MALVAGIWGERLRRVLLAILTIKRVIMVVNIALDVDTISDVQDKRAGMPGWNESDEKLLTPHGPGLVQLKPRYLKLPRPG